MTKKTLIFIIFILLIPLGYLIFYRQLQTQWTALEPIITLLTYCTSVLLLWYNSDLKFHFFVTRVIMFFKYDYTTWLISSRYTFKDEKKIVLSELKEYFIKCNQSIRVKDETYNFLEILIENKFLISFRIKEENNTELYLYTSKIIVPAKQNKKQISDIVELLENVERFLNLELNDEKVYEIDIEYKEKSPYYTYWIKKLPEERISNFNCSISLPNKNEKITVNKNHLYIKSDRYNQLFNLTTDYVSLKAV